MSTSERRLYRVQFMNQGKIYELYAESVGSSSMLGFIEISGFTFGEKSSLVLNPTEESLKNEFSNVKRSFIPMHSVIRIDEVDKRGKAKVIESGKDGKIAHLPYSVFNPIPNKPDH